MEIEAKDDGEKGGTKKPKKAWGGRAAASERARTFTRAKAIKKVGTTRSTRRTRSTSKTVYTSPPMGRTITNINSNKAGDNKRKDRGIVLASSGEGEGMV